MLRTFSQVEKSFALLSTRFIKVIWVLGNHELWTTSNDEVQLWGEAHCQKLVDVCGVLGVVTLEGPYPRWQTATGPVVIAPPFVLYDYTFRPAGTQRLAAVLPGVPNQGSEKA